MTDTFLVAPWPLVCDSCTKALAKSVYDRIELKAITLYCPHLQTLVLARCGEHEGKRAVLRWEVVGPLDEAEALTMMRGLSGVTSFENLDLAKLH
jgi:hypothetical protein